MAALLLFLPFSVQADCPMDCLGRDCLSPCYNICGISCAAECSPNCYFYMISDSICQPECQVEQCGYDHQDCQTRKLYTTITIANSSSIEENNQVSEKNYGKVAGVGLGVFLTIMAMILGIIICVIGAATPVFFVFLLIGILIPLITFLIVAFAPLHKDQKEKADTRTDDYFAARLIFLIFIIIFAVFAIVKLFEYYVGINLKAKGVNSNISKISSADLIAPADGQNPDNAANNPLAQTDLNPDGNPLLRDNRNPLTGNRNPLEGNRNPLAGNRNPLDESRNPLNAGRNPLLGDSEEHPLAPPRNPLLK